MSIKFIDREHELGFLEEAYKGKRPQFIVIYGKRRVGKTELIKQFFRNKPHIYFLADKRPKESTIIEFSSRVMEFFGDKALAKAGFTNWIDLFGYVKEKVGERRVVLVIDEFPYLVEVDKAIPSLFQKLWDEYLAETNMFLILCGSSISMMEREVLAYRSPMYGRRTGQIKLDPLPFKEVVKFFPGIALKKIVEFYSVLGGVPAYLLNFSPEKDVFRNVEEEVFEKGKPLYEEVEFILREELRESTNYFSILKAISLGKTSMNEIAQASFVKVTKLPRYLGVLERIKIAERIVPITEKNPLRSKRGIYQIQDNFFRFWFRFVYPYKSDIEGGNVNVVMGEVKRSFNQFASHTFEDICKQALWELSKQKGLPFMFTRVGKWWYKDNEIDIVALNDETKEILFTECKWQDKKVGKDVAENLLEKKELVDWNKGERKGYFAIFSKSGFKKSCLEYCKENKILTFDLNQIEEIFTPH